MTMLVKRTRGNQVSLPKRILAEAGVGDEDRYFDVQYRHGLICLKPVTIEEKISDRAYEGLLRWAAKAEPGDKVFRSGREAVEYLKRIAKKPRG
jgi:hypothetical protein